MIWTLKKPMGKFPVGTRVEFISGSSTHVSVQPAGSTEFLRVSLMDIEKQNLVQKALESEKSTFDAAYDMQILTPDRFTVRLTIMQTFLMILQDEHEMAAFEVEMYNHWPELHSTDPNYPGGQDPLADPALNPETDR